MSHLPVVKMSGEMTSMERIEGSEKELERVTAFQSTLGSIVEIKPVSTEMNLKEVNPVDDKVEHFMRYERLGKTALYLDPGFQDYKSSEEIRFEPLTTRVGKNSMHGVFFGNLVFDEQGEVPVAVKPYVDDKPNQASSKDYFNNVAVKELGISSLLPVGFVIDGKDQAYSMTRLEDSLTTLDSIDWSGFYPNIDEHRGMREIWSQTARQLALVHSLGSIMHGDIAARNIGIAPDNGGAILIDWEHSHISLHSPRDAEVRYSYSHNDLNTLVESMCLPRHINFKPGIGIFYGKDGDWWGTFDELFYEEYASLRADYAVLGNHKGAVAASVNEELEVLENSLKDSMVMQKDICSQIPPA